MAYIVKVVMGDSTNLMQKMIAHMEKEEIRQEIGKKLPELALISDSNDFAELLAKYITYPDGLQIVSKDWKSIYNNCKHCEKSLAIMMFDEEIRKQVLENMDFLLNYGDYTSKGKLVNVLSKFEGSNEVIVANFDILFENCMEDLQYLVIPCLKTENGIRKIKERFSSIKERFLSWSVVEEINVKGFFDFIKALKDIPEFENEYNEYIYWAELYDQIQIPEYKFDNPSMIFELSKKEIRKILTARDAKHIKNIEFVNIINSEDREEKKLILQEVANGNKYEYKSCGSSSLIIQAGNQVVKLGAGRRKFEVPYHPRIMMPYFRKRYTDGSCLEVFNYGDVDSAEITDEKLLEIYKELESAGILWGDARKDNLVVLLKDNDIPDFIKSDDFNIFGFLEDSHYPTDKHTSLKAGEIVVCDLDMLYVKGDPSYEKGILDDIIEDYVIFQKNGKNLFDMWSNFESR